jgi:hypothetical protein
MAKTWNWIPVGAGVRAGSFRNHAWRQLAGDYHGRRVIAGDSPKALIQHQFQSSRIARLNDAVQLALACGGGDATQGLQQTPTDAHGPESGRYHERELGPELARDILGMTEHCAIDADGQHRDTVALIKGVDAVQQRQIGRLTVCEVTLVEALAIHRGEESGHPVAILRDGGA